MKALIAAFILSCNLFAQNLQTIDSGFVSCDPTLPAKQLVVKLPDPSCQTVTSDFKYEYRTVVTITNHWNVPMGIQFHGTTLFTLSHNPLPTNSNAFDLVQGGGALAFVVVDPGSTLTIVTNPVTYTTPATTYDCLPWHQHSGFRRLHKFYFKPVYYDASYDIVWFGQAPPEYSGHPQYFVSSFKPEARVFGTLNFQ